MLTSRVEDAFIGPVAHGAAMLPQASQAQQGPFMPSSIAQDSYSPSSVYYQEQFVQTQVVEHNADAGPAVSVPTEMQKNNQEQIAALVSSREREVNELQTTLAVPLAHFNAKFIWHCIMNIERDCECVLLSSFHPLVLFSYFPTLPRRADRPRELCDIVAVRARGLSIRLRC